MNGVGRSARTALRIERSDAECEPRPGGQRWWDVRNRRNCSTHRGGHLEPRRRTDMRHGECLAVGPFRASTKRDRGGTAIAATVAAAGQACIRRRVRHPLHHLARCCGSVMGVRRDGCRRGLVAFMMRWCGHGARRRLWAGGQAKRRAGRQHRRRTGQGEGHHEAAQPACEGAHVPSIRPVPRGSDRVAWRQRPCGTLAAAATKARACCNSGRSAALPDATVSSVA